MKVVILCLLVLSLGVLGCGQRGKILTTGDKAPEFSLLDLDGRQVSLDDLLKGKEVILNFWASWCPECRTQMPRLNAFAKRYKDKMEIIGINVQEPKRTVTDFIKEIGIDYKILLDSKGEVNKLYGVMGVPTNVLINKEGLIKNQNMDIREMESYLRKE